MCLDKIKNLLSKIDRSSFEIAFWNGLGSLLAVGIPTVIDPLIEHHARYGSRTYPLENWVLLISLVVFYLTYISNINNTYSIKKKALLTLLAIIVPTWATLPFFKPEFPHLNVASMPIYFGLLSTGIVILRGYKIDFSFLNDSNTTNPTKLCDKKLHHKLPCATPSVWGNPTEICASGNAGV